MSFNSIINEVESITANSEAPSITSSVVMKLAKDVQDKVDMEAFDRTPELKVLRDPFLKKISFPFH
jgi:hypothetical protein